jgi:2'-5' RNA ligase
METVFQKYFIGIVLPTPIKDEVEQLKNHCSELYATKGALRSPPHITLHMPFLVKEQNENLVVKKLSSFCAAQKSFQIVLAGFGCFAPRVIFVGVSENKALQQFQKELVKFCRVAFNLFNADYKDQPFQPHVTIAFRDLRKPMFERAWEEFKHRNFNAEFTVCSIALLKYDGKCWNVFMEFPIMC